MIEKSFQDWYIYILKIKKIDFFRLNNSTFVKKTNNYNTKAVFEEGARCDKFWPDIEFCFNGKVFMREFGIAGKNKERKRKQGLRMEYWGKNGNVDTKFLMNHFECECDLANIGVL